jgi:hypothetical protein
MQGSSEETVSEQSTYAKDVVRWDDSLRFTPHSWQHAALLVGSKRE